MQEDAQYQYEQNLTREHHNYRQWVRFTETCFSQQTSAIFENHRVENVDGIGRGTNQEQKPVAAILQQIQRAPQQDG